MAISQQNMLFYSQNNAALSTKRAGPSHGPTICFIPGWGGDHWIWQQNFEACAMQNDTIIVDFPGFGRSQLTKSQLEIEASAQLIVEMLNASGVKDCVLVGHSLGGALALAVASILNKRALAVVAVDSLVFNVIYPKTTEPMIEEIMSPFKTDFKQAIDDLTATYFSENTALEDKERVLKDMHQSNPEHGIFVLENYLAWDREAYMERYHGPIHAIVANVHQPIIDSQLLERVIVKVINETGHYIMLDQCEALQSYLTDIIAPQQTNNYAIKD